MEGLKEMSFIFLFVFTYNKYNTVVFKYLQIAPYKKKPLPIFRPIKRPLRFT